MQRVELLSCLAQLGRLLMIVMTLGLTACLPSGGDESSVPVNNEPPASDPAPIITPVLPDDIDVFAATLYPVLTGESNCRVCHTETGPGFPAFASLDVNTAYQQAVSNQVANLNKPNKSRLYVRLVEEEHNCWGDCAENGATLLAAIEAWAAQSNKGAALTLLSSQVPFSSVDTAVTDLPNGLITAYSFNEREGETVMDVSGIEPLMPLTLSGNYEWLGDSQGVRFIQGIGKTAEPATKLNQAIKATNEFTVELWIQTAQDYQMGSNRIVSLGVDVANVNFSVRQSRRLPYFGNRNLSPGIDQEGEPALIASGKDAVFDSTKMQHLVATFNVSTGRTLYLDGGLVAQEDELSLVDVLDNWDDAYRLTIANLLQQAAGPAWQGVMYSAAFYNRTFSADEVAQQYSKGLSILNQPTPILSFDLGELLPCEHNELQLQAYELDEWSYEFVAPVFVHNCTEPVKIGGMRIGVNEDFPISGQVFTHMLAEVPSVTTDFTQMDLATDDIPIQSFQLSSLGALIRQDQGAELDNIILHFEYLGEHQDLIVTPDPIAPELTDDTIEAAVIGIKTFDQLDLTMSELTGVDRSDMLGIFSPQTLPENPNPRGLSGAHNTAIANMAFEYCQAMVSDSALRDHVLPDVDFSQSAQIVLRDSDLWVNLVDRFLGTAYPNGVEIESLLGSLAHQFADVCDRTRCNNQRKIHYVSGVCMAALANAAVVLH